jgi:hypothetical protein
MTGLNGRWVVNNRVDGGIFSSRPGWGVLEDYSLKNKLSFKLTKQNAKIQLKKKKKSLKNVKRLSPFHKGLTGPIVVFPFHLIPLLLILHVTTRSLSPLATKTTQL